MKSPLRVCFRLWLWFTLASVPLSAQPVISEFMASNGQVLADEDGEFVDWIELENPGAAAFDLDGWYLTNDLKQRDLWRLPKVSIPAGGRLVVFASGKDRRDPVGKLHTNFSLPAQGGDLALIARDADTVVSAFPSYPRQYRNISYGTLPFFDQTVLAGYLRNASPGALNQGGFLEFVKDTQFSHHRGFYTQPFDLVISSATPGAVIYYTLDGTPPARTNGVVFSQPIHIDATSVVRARAVKDGLVDTDVDTQTFLFHQDVIKQAADGKAPKGWPTSWGSNTVDYGMDPDVVNDPVYSKTIVSDLKSLPSFSVVMDLRDLFNSTRGIYANAGQDGADWERPCSLELINTNGTSEFQINAGIRIRGGFSRSTGNPKHALRFFFREDYGDPRLNYPLFGKQGADSFNAVDLRTFQNYSWSFQGDSRGVFIRDQFSRDTQLAMGHQAERGNYYHLYINGYYWGLYNTCERPEASYGETYFGGKAENYDVIKVEAGPYTINATDGNMAAWTRLWQAAKAGLASDAAYFKIQGRNPDGSPNPAYENLIDADNLIDYMLVILYGGNLDAPISNFLGNSSPNNFYGMRDRTGSVGFRFFSHDAEHTLLNVNEDRNGPYSAGTTLDKSNPQWVWQQMQANAEFKLRVADHVQKHFFNGGALTAAACSNRFQARMREIDRAVVAESARWGDAKVARPLTRANWLTACNTVLSSFIARRSDVIVSQMKTRKLYPSVVAPSLSPFGGRVSTTQPVLLSAAAGTVYYTLDGSDPRLVGGALSARALKASAALTLETNTLVRARVLDGTNWSALVEAPFQVKRDLSALRLTEIFYNPPPTSTTDGQEFEFLEFANTGNVELDLRGATISDGVTFAFGDAVKLAPGAVGVVVKDATAFASRYPNVRILGVFEGQLSNSGEKITLKDSGGDKVFTVDYQDASPWPKTPDGGGFSLVRIDPSNPADPSDPARWRASPSAGGSPGVLEVAPLIPAVVVNEVVPGAGVELFNPTGGPADVGGWFLTDDSRVPTKFRIPPNTVIPEGGFWVVPWFQLATTVGGSIGFPLRKAGGKVALFSAGEAGVLTGYSESLSYDGCPEGLGYGRSVDSTGRVATRLLAKPTLGSANAAPFVGSVVFQEIRYQDADGEPWFVEIRNTSTQPRLLAADVNPDKTWQIAGLSFRFPVGLTLPPGGLAVIAGADPAYMRSRYGIPASVPVLLAADGKPSTTSETLELREFLPAPFLVASQFMEVPVDVIHYDSVAPWPVLTSPAASLQRVNLAAPGDDPGNWRASNEPTPGFNALGNRAPTVFVSAPLVVETNAIPLQLPLHATAKDDGLPLIPGKLSVAWELVSGPARVTLDTPSSFDASARFTAPGVYTFRFNASDGEFSQSALTTIEIKLAPQTVILIPTGATWRYFDTSAEPGVGWFTPGFADGAWQTGKARLGYGGDGEVTTIGFGGNASAKLLAAYFRGSFNVADVSKFSSVALRLLRDDGAAVYINGKEVLRDNLPAGALSGATAASATVGDTAEQTFYDFAVDRSVLVNGANVIAVEVHQVNGTSSDLSFDLELTAQVAASDGGGGDTFAAFQSRFFSKAELADPRVSGDTVDPDGDGMSNFAEYVAGTDPRDAASRLALRASSQRAAIDGSPQIRFTFARAAGRGYIIESSSLVKGGDWTTVYESAPEGSAGAGEWVAPISTTRAGAFYRLRVR